MSEFTDTERQAFALASMSPRRPAGRIECAGSEAWARLASGEHVDSGVLHYAYADLMDERHEGTTYYQHAKHALDAEFAARSDGRDALTLAQCAAAMTRLLSETVLREKQIESLFRIQRHSECATETWRLAFEGMTHARQNAKDRDDIHLLTRGHHVALALFRRSEADE